MIHNEIPPMTAELSRFWEQPSTSEILIDDTHAVMNEGTFRALKDYTASQPTGAYEGKMWRTTGEGNKWYLAWFGYSDKPNRVSNNYRLILLID